ncbi:hypothetical protein [Saccharopolyspora gloriosae]|uniref:hypothetical protein n=1 Tax=Saccharopolyspora gloriosae TaxID=455344 RepID=UPI001FB7B803|nr:hypothetical protein [Saccharopolyspora gloriosae]
MQAKSPAGRSNHSWLKWGVPIAVLVLLAAGVGGIIAQRSYSSPVRAGMPGGTPESDGSHLANIEFTPDAEAHPDSADIRWTLQMHFNAINMRRYETWKATVVEEKQKQLPEDKWQQEYATTRDAAVKVHRVEPGPKDSLRILMTFVSTQDPKAAPPGLESSCLRWSVVYPMVVDAGGFRLDTNSLPGSALAVRC